MTTLSRITFAGAGPKLDRAAHRREAADGPVDGDLAVVLSEGRIAVALDGPEKRLLRLPAREVGTGTSVLLGTEDGRSLVAVDVGPLDDGERVALFGGAAKFIDLRSISPELPASDGEIAAIARAMLGWHERHRFCANCGGASVMEAGGWRRRCPACGATHFPRVDPVVIMLVLRDDHVLIGRQPQWPEGLHSLLAGYVEPGETPEDAVRREVMEEAGVPVGRVRYVASQPWPFPSTLMIGCVAEALDWPLTVDRTELESAEWVAREDMAAAIDGRHPRLGAPRPDAIARSLIAAWLSGEVEGF